MAGSPEVSVCRIERGTCFVLIAYDIGLAVRLDQAEALITERTRRAAIRRKRRSPRHIDYVAPPLRTGHTVSAVPVGSTRVASRSRLLRW